MTARTVVITGANSGIGLETAVVLAQLGDRVVIACRSAERADAAVAVIRTRSGSDAVESVELDLADFGSIQTCATELATRTPEIDVLINNAGLMLSERETTAQGFEATFGVNHLGPFLLTQLLRPQITAASEPRVINLSSLAHMWAIGGLKFDRLNGGKRYHGWLAYGRSKLCNIYFTQELASRWADDGVAVNALHPGSVNTRFGQDGDTKGLSGLLMKLAPLVTISPERGADTSVFLATSDSGGEQTGVYWSKRRPGRTAPWAKRPAAAAELWDVSEQYVAAGHP
jgi:NAD(P)-dependent dehydrogenase (short-subunit alcohol dehydrogenase family)